MPQSASRPFVRPTLASAGALVVVALPSFLLGAFAPSIKDDLGFGDAELGALFTAGFFVSAVVLQMSGQAADSRGPRVVIRLGLVLAAAGAAALSTITTSLAVLVLAFSISRTAEAVVQPATNTLVSRSIPPHQRGRAMGIKQAAIPFSTALAGAAVPLLGSSIGWQGAFAIVGLLAVPAWVAIPASEPGPVRRSQTRGQLWRARHLRLLAAGGALAAASVVTVASFLTTAAEDAGYSEASAGLLLTLGGGLMVCSRLIWGLLADRFRFDRFAAVALAVGSGSTAYLALATGSRAWLVVGTAIVFGLGWSWPGLLILGIIERHPNEPGAATAVVQTSVRLGALTSPLLFGIVAEQAGFGVAWLLPFAFALCGAFLFWLGARSSRELNPTAVR